MKPIVVVAPAIVAGAWLAANTVNAAVSAWSRPDPEPPAIERASAASEEWERDGRPKANRARTIREAPPRSRGSDSSIRLAAFGEGREVSAACPASVQVLSAIVSDEWPDATIAAVRIENHVGVVQRGDLLADAAVERVHVDGDGIAEVVLAIDGELVACRALPRGIAGPAAFAGIEVATGVSCVAGSACTISRGLVEAIATGERTDAWAGTRVVPYFEGGKPVGFKLYGIRPGTEVAKLGLQNGDVVKSVNGIELQSPGTVFTAYGQLRNESEFTVALLRAGREETLRVEVR